MQTLPPTTHPFIVRSYSLHRCIIARSSPHHRHLPACPSPPAITPLSPYYYPFISHHRPLITSSPPAPCLSITPPITPLSPFYCSFIAHHRTLSVPSLLVHHPFYQSALSCGPLFLQRPPRLFLFLRLCCVATSSSGALRSNSIAYISCDGRHRHQSPSSPSTLNSPFLLAKF